MKSRGWGMPEREATPEDVYLNRRRFLKVAGLGAAGLLAGCGQDKGFEPDEGGETQRPARVSAPASSGGAQGPADSGRDVYPAPLNPAFGELDRPLTPEIVAGRFNNFYELTQKNEEVWQLAWMLQTRPWTVEIAGLVGNPATYDIDDLVGRMPLEERLYRLRCVEAWSMAVPWTGFPMALLLDAVEPLSAARYVKMTSLFDPPNSPGVWDTPGWPWPYTEALTIEEAANELTLLVTGIYGHELSSQHGAPLRLVVPWKYGYKSVKSIVRIEFVEERPETFWNSLQPAEYGFLANVNPGVPHPAWSQETEVMLGTGEERPTLLFNGYGEYVAHLYG